MEQKSKKAPRKAGKFKPDEVDASQQPSRPITKRRSQIDSTLYFIEREGDDVPLSHFKKFDLT